MKAGCWNAHARCKVIAFEGLSVSGERKIVRTLSSIHVPKSGARSTPQLSVFEKSGGLFGHCVSTLATSSGDETTEFVHAAGSYAKSNRRQISELFPFGKQSQAFLATGNCVSSREFCSLEKARSFDLPCLGYHESELTT